jgi:hypothetical protein
MKAHANVGSSSETRISHLVGRSRKVTRRTAIPGKSKKNRRSTPYIDNRSNSSRLSMLLLSAIAPSPIDSCGWTSNPRGGGDSTKSVHVPLAEAIHKARRPMVAPAHPIVSHSRQALLIVVVVTPRSHGSAPRWTESIHGSGVGIARSSECRRGKWPNNVVLKKMTEKTTASGILCRQRELVPDALMECAMAAARAVGVASTTGEILTILDAVDWDRAGKLYDWRNHVPSSLRGLWSALSSEARVAVFLLACELASEEELTS